MFDESIEYYDAIYHWKDYEHESARLLEILARVQRSPGRRLLDVACGTGAHIPFLSDQYEVTGVDIHPGFLAIAKKKCPGVRFLEADMTGFDLGEQFDVLTCLFSSIGYADSVSRLESTCRAFAAHVVPGGVVIVEPWLTPDVFKPNTVHMNTVDEEALKISRITNAELEGRHSIFHMHHLIGRPDRVDYILEVHRLYLFTPEEMTRALENAGFQVSFDDEGLMGRGLYIGVRA